MTEARKPGGIRWFGGDNFHLANLTLKVADDGTALLEEVRVELRTDMWPYWLEEAIDAAVLASGFAEQIPALVEQRDAAYRPGTARRYLGRGFPPPRSERGIGDLLLDLARRDARNNLGALMIGAVRAPAGAVQVSDWFDADGSDAFRVVDPHDTVLTSAETRPVAHLAARAGRGGQRD
jgi:hypothetical protein